MSNLLTYKNNSKSLLKLSEDGLMKEKLNLNLSKCKSLEIDSSTMKTSSKSLEQIPNKNQKLKKVSAMQESLPNIKKKTLNDKSIILETNSQTMKLSKISDRPSTTTEKDFKPFWNSSLKNLSNRLWLPTVTDCQDSILNSYHGSLKNLTAPSWYSTKLQIPILKSNCHKMSLVLSHTSLQKTTECGLPKTEKKEIMRAKKIKLYPTVDQKTVLNHWFGSRRWVYNQCLNYINQKKQKRLPSMKELRSLFLNGKEMSTFSNGTPFDIRDGGMIDLLKNFKSNVAKIKTKSISHFKLTFLKSKYAQSIAVCHKYYGTKGMYSILTDIKKSEPEEMVIKQVKHDFRILKDNNGDYWICLPITKISQSERQAREFSNDRDDGTISLDPGVRTFLVGYDGQNKTVLHFGTDASKKIKYICIKLDSLISKSKNETQRKKVRLKKAIRHLRKKIQNMVTDMHYKVANFLCENYKTVIIPEFETQKMVSGGKLNSRVARSMMNLSHYLFRKRLLSVSEEYINCSVEIVSEEFTSQTCGKCGELNKDLGSNKVFKCVNKKCKIEIDRDVNGARNILLKNY